MKYAIFTALVLFGLLTGMTLVACNEHDYVVRYHEYYVTTEALLDSLEEHFHWVDRYDSKVVDNYYKTRRALR